MSLLRVLTVDDEPLALERVSSLVKASPHLTLIGEASNGLQALDLVAKLEPDLIFIDVEMPELSGFGVVAALDADKAPGVVFITAYEQYAVKAFEVGAIDYLSKPVSQARFDAAATRAMERLDKRSSAERIALVESAATAEQQRGRRTRFVVRNGNAHYFVPIEHVEWIDAADNYLRLHASERTHLWRGTMKDAEDQLDPNLFVRIHRSAIVAVNRIASVNSADGGHIVVLLNGVRLKTSRQYADRVRALLK
jgi:two-component system LytT family response regulator